ncbi:MAG: hypothetical protein K6E10_02815 [Eubacterium sp.]|nr:hypothetical protein [Eubacterium sp.]
MKNLYKAIMKRIITNPFFILGCIAAFAITLIISWNNSPVQLPISGNTNDKMIFLSAAIVAFFTIFVPLLTNIEYSDGVIRNKLISGYTQVQVYISSLLGHMTAAFIMWAVYMLAGILAGADMTGKFIFSNIVILVAILNYVATMMILAFRLRKMIPLVIGVMLVFQLCFNLVTIGNLFISLSKGTLNKIIVLIYNIPALGQWFSNTSLGEEFNNPGRPIQLLISIAVIIICTFIGTFRLNKRDLT